MVLAMIKQREDQLFHKNRRPGIKALANNLNNRTDAFGDIAFQYANEPEFVYKTLMAPKIYRNH